VKLTRPSTCLLESTPCSVAAALRVSRICLGSATFGVAPRAEEASALVSAAIDLGINFFDTANSYGNQPRFDRRRRATGCGACLGGKRSSARRLLGRRHEAVIGTKVQEAVGPGFRTDRGLSRGAHPAARPKQRPAAVCRPTTSMSITPTIRTPRRQSRRRSTPSTRWCSKVRCATGGLLWLFPPGDSCRLICWPRKRLARLPICHQVGYITSSIRAVEAESSAGVVLDLGLSLTAFRAARWRACFRAPENLERNDVGSQRWGGFRLLGSTGLPTRSKCKSIAREAGVPSGAARHRLAG